MHLPADWPRINQFPEYFTVEKEKNYSVSSNKSYLNQTISGKELQQGLPVRIKSGSTIKLIIQ